MTSIKIENKYLFFKFNSEKNKIILIEKGNSKSELIKSINKKNINNKYDILLMKLEKKKEWSLNTKIPINMLGGPIKISFLFFTLTNKNKLKNKEDARSIQILYYTWEYYQKYNIKTKDLKEVAKLSFLNKLEKRLLAPKLIDQINKLKN
jgi:hypothetical protein